MNDELAAIVSDIDPMDASDDVYAEAYMKVVAIERWAKDQIDLLRTKMIETLKSTGRTEIGWKVSDDASMRFWLGQSKTEKCRNPQKAFETLMQFDVNDAIGCLSSNSWKHGAVKKLLAKEGKSELYKELFETIYKDKLEVDAPKPALPRTDTSELQSIDERFLR